MNFLKKSKNNLISKSAISALAAVNAFFSVQTVEADPNKNKEIEKTESLKFKKSAFRLNASLSEDDGNAYSFGVGIFTPLNTKRGSITFFDSSFSFNYDEIVNKSDQYINQDKSGFSTSFRLGRRSIVNEKWVGGINFGVNTRSINYFSPKGFLNGVVEIEFLSNKLNIIPYANFSLDKEKNISKTTTTQSSLLETITTTKNYNTTPINTYGVKFEKNINEKLTFALNGFYSEEESNLKDGFGLGLSFSYIPGKRFKVNSGIKYDPIFDTNLNTSIEYKIDSSLDNYDKRLIKIPENREIPLKIYNNQVIEKSITPILDPSMAFIPSINFESNLIKTADDLINFEDIKNV